MGAVKTKYLINILTICGWCLILGITIFWSSRSGTESINRFGMVMFLLNIIPLLFIYAINSYLFMPKLYFVKGRRVYYFVANGLFLALLLLVSCYIDNREIAAIFGVDDIPPRPKVGFSHMARMARDLVNYILMIGFVTGIKLMGRLQRSEEALREAENARIKAELTNLKSQLNPHFLLNTLNNIYALTAIDPERAQKTIKELSLLLRYVLYDNHAERVLLTREVEFLRNYIELMRIRLSSQVRLSVKYDIAPQSTAEIAPLIFISLIENAFKHGVDAAHESFIEIRIACAESSGEITLSITNSNNAKNNNDKSGRGIGLDQVRRRLELQYKDQYEWAIHEDPKIYQSVLTLKS